jgi:hypothetical protein
VGFYSIVDFLVFLLVLVFFVTQQYPQRYHNTISTTLAAFQCKIKDFVEIKSILVNPKWIQKHLGEIISPNRTRTNLGKLILPQWLLYLHTYKWNSNSKFSRRGMQERTEEAINCLFFNWARWRFWEHTIV